jgi:hypothetical protein
MRYYAFYSILIVMFTMITGCAPSKQSEPVSVHIRLFGTGNLHTLGTTSTDTTYLPTLTALQFHLGMFDLKITGTDFSPIHIITPADGGTITAAVLPGSSRYISLTAIPDQLSLPSGGEGISYLYSYYYGFTQTDITTEPDQSVVLQMDAVPLTPTTFVLVDSTGQPYTQSAYLVMEDSDTGYQPPIPYPYDNYSYYAGIYYPATLLLPVGYDVKIYAVDALNMSIGTTVFSPFTTTITQTTITMIGFTPTAISGSYTGQLWVGEGVTPFTQQGLSVQLFTEGNLTTTPTFSTTTDTSGGFTFPDILPGYNYLNIVDPVTGSFLTSYGLITVSNRHIQSRVGVPTYTLYNISEELGTYNTSKGVQLLCLVISAPNTYLSFTPPAIDALLTLSFITQTIGSMDVLFSATDYPYLAVFDATPITGSTNYYTFQSELPDGNTGLIYIYGTNIPVNAVISIPNTPVISQQGSDMVMNTIVITFPPVALPYYTVWAGIYDVTDSPGNIPSGTDMAVAYTFTTNTSSFTPVPFSGNFIHGHQYAAVVRFFDADISNFTVSQSYPGQVDASEAVSAPVTYQ